MHNVKINNYDMHKKFVLEILLLLKLAKILLSFFEFLITIFKKKF